MKKAKTAVALGAFIALGLGVKVEAETVPQTGVNRIHFINTKANSGSDAILLESNGHYALIDMGEDYDFPDGTNPLYPIRFGNAMRNYQVLEDRLFRHLSNVGVQKLDFILGTHVHSDHIGGADEVLNKLPVDTFYLKKYSDQRIKASWGLWDNLYNYDNALKAAKEKGVKLVQDISDKDSHFKLGDMDIQLYNYKNEYGPDGQLKKVLDDNSNSIVAVITVNGQKIYLGGDLDNAEGAEDKLGPQIGKVDLMKWNHHYDAKISNSINFINNLSPTMIVQTTGADINVDSTKDYIQKKGIQIIHSSSKTQNATVFDISKNGFKNISDAFPNIPTVKAQWYQEDGFWKYRLADDQMAIGWHEINGKFYFFNGKGQMQTSRWIYTNDSWDEHSTGEYYYVHADGSRQPAGWFWHEGAWYYIQSDGTRRQNGLAYSGNNQYLFDKDGKMLTGWQTFNGKRMLFASSGELLVENDQASAWKKVNGKWYYFDNNNVAVTGLKEIDGKTYFFDESGVMQTGWKEVDGVRRYFASSGAMATGWLKDGDSWYLLSKEGKKLTGDQEVDGEKYYLNEEGIMQTGWKWIDGKYRYYAKSGALKKGWLKDGNKWYYLNPENGEMVTGEKEIDKVNYYFVDSGAMAVGWKWHDEAYYYYQSSGSMLKGWYKESGKWYYLNPETGKMVTRQQEVSGKYYYFNDSGAMQTGWKWHDGAYHYYQASGAMLKGWYKEAGKWYFLHPTTGAMLTGIQEISGDDYYFNNFGAMQVGWIKDNGEWYYFKSSGAMLRNGTTPDGYKVDGEGRWLPNGVTTTTTTTTTTTSTTETTTAEETTQEQTTQETTVESTTAEPTTEQKTIPINSDKTSEITDANEIG